MLKPGGTVVEGTAGNTGIGMAHVCNAKGYKLVIYMPDTQSVEKMDLLRALGAEVRAVPAVAFTDPENYNHQARRYAESLPNACWGNQFDNVANRMGHYWVSIQDRVVDIRAQDQRFGNRLKGRLMDGLSPREQEELMQEWLNISKSATPRFNASWLIHQGACCTNISPTGNWNERAQDPSQRALAKDESPTT